MSELRPPGRRVLDLSGMATYGYGTRSLMWWGTWGMILIEGTVFALAVVTYFYLSQYSFHWPPAPRKPPDLIFGTANLIVLMLSAVPNQWTKHVAEKEDLRQVRIGLLVCLAFALVSLALRGFEFGALNTAWNDSAYGSIVFALMLLHTVHLITDVIDTIVLAVLMFTSRISGRRFSDVSENSMYWYFVVASWLVIYGTVYIAPRVI
jgi:cytochrome c oxidase subunit III